MKVCMLVYNNVTRDNRVIREASTLQAAGHQVTIIGIPDNNLTTPEEVLESGVVVRRVEWRPNARRKLLLTTPLRILPVLAVCALLAWAVSIWVVNAMPALKSFGVSLSHASASSSAVGWIGFLAGVIAVAFAVFYLGRWLVRMLIASHKRENARRDYLMRHAEELIASKALDPKDYPKPRTRIPGWIPDFVLETLLEPLAWLSARANRFVFYRYRSREMADFAISLKPDVVHAHDCTALPTGVLVKNALNIPLVYDAHEIYEAAASRRSGITDYYTRTHRRYVGDVDHFITINQSIALFYRYAYQKLPPAIIIRNAARRSRGVEYDGRLHTAAGLPRSQKILLYQGGYTQERGLPMLVEAATHLPDDWTLVMMGWGPLDSALRQIATSAAKQKVVFIPAAPRDELELWTAGGTVGIVPYENTVLNHWFCSPNKLWEYPVAGVPLIVQPFPELRKVIETFDCGWLLPEDLSALAIADLIGGLNDDKISNARQGCRAFIDADCWESAYSVRLIDLYAGLEPSAIAQKKAPNILQESSLAAQ